MPDEVTKVKKSELSLYFDRPEIKANIVEVLKDKAETFAASIISLAGTDTKLKECSPIAVLREAMKAAVLDLPLIKSFGFAFIIPYNENKKVGNAWTKVMTPHFQMGYKGYIQLAKRSGLYKRMTTTVIKEGEMTNFDPIRENYGFKIEQDTAKRSKMPTIGYVFFFLEQNGFEKLVYMTKDQVAEHGQRYSKSFGNEKGLWKNDFDAMGLKTVVLQGLTKWGTLSTKLQTQNEFSEALKNDGDFDIPQLNPDDEIKIPLKKPANGIAPITKPKPAPVQKEQPGPPVDETYPEYKEESGQPDKPEAPKAAYVKPAIAKEEPSHEQPTSTVDWE